MKKQQTSGWIFYLCQSWDALLPGTRCSPWSLGPTQWAPETSPSTAPGSAPCTRTCGCSEGSGSSSLPESSALWSLLLLGTCTCSDTKTPVSFMRQMFTWECGELLITNPLTKLSDVPPVFIAVKFFASLIRTCSSPPASVAAFLPEERETCRFEAKCIKHSQRYSFLISVLPLVFSDVGFLGVMYFKEITSSPLYWAKAETGTTEAACRREEHSLKRF